MSHPVVLLIHGVNSTGEWHDTTIRECHGLFRCVSIKYRHFHGITGPVKVYAWPTAVLAAAALFAALMLEGSALGFVVVLALLGITVGIVIHAEYEWSGRTFIAQPPLIFSFIGIMGAFALHLDDRIRLAIPLGAIVATALYLDLREYGESGQSAISVMKAFVIALGALVAAAWAAHELLVHQEAGWWAFMGLCVAAAIEPWVRRQAAFRTVRRQIDAARAHSLFPPHVVAHSLGTYLVGHLVNENDRFFLGRVILTGCVLDRGFPWHLNLGPGTLPRCRGVKNYVGRLDLVPLITGTLRAAWVALTLPFRAPGIVKGTRFVADLCRWRPLGRAGQGGFRNLRNMPSVVHSLKDDVICNDCKTIGPAPVHNVLVRFGGHSDLNGFPEYQFFVWLPFFLGDHVETFEYWQGLCLLGNAAVKELEKLDPLHKTPRWLELETDLANTERLMRKGPWYWPLASHDVSSPSVGRPLIEYVEEMRQPGTSVAAGPSTAKLLERIPRIIFQKFVTALAEKKKKAPDPTVTAWLEPRTVFIAAVHDAIKMGP